MRKAISTGLFYILIFISLLSILSFASALCASPASVGVEFNTATIVFSGKVIGEKLIGDDVQVADGGIYNSETTFEVLKVWKGDVSGNIVVKTDYKSLIINKTYLVYAININNEFRVLYCGDTKLLSEANEDIKELDEITAMGVVSAADSGLCTKDSDCKVKLINCACRNVCVSKDEGSSIDCARACTPEESNLTINSCVCENKRCVGQSTAREPVCGNNICEKGEANDLGGCGPNADPRCLGPPGRDGTCPQDCVDERLPGQNKTKILPETASQRARERLGELGFNISLKEVGKGNETKEIYEVSGEKEGKMFGLFKIRGKVSVEVDAETGEIVRIKKPWWSFLASGI